MIERLLEMLKKGCYLTDLRNELKISDSSIANVLDIIEQKGYPINRTVGSKGVRFSLDRTIKLYHQYRFQGDSLKILLISDTHLGCIYDRVDILHNLFEYATMKGIKIVIHTGDFIEGVKYADRGCLKYDNIDDMTKYAIKNYPKDKNINTYVLGGNHDLWSKQILNYDINDMLEAHRPDIITLGYTHGCIKLNRDFVFLEHSCSNGRGDNTNEFEEYTDLEAAITLKGHTHISLIKEDPLIIYIPCLYDNYKNRLKGAWEAELHFEQGKITDIELSPLVVEPRIQPVTNIHIKTLKNS